VGCRSAASAAQCVCIVLSSLKDTQLACCASIPVLYGLHWLSHTQVAYAAAPHTTSQPHAHNCTRSAEPLTYVFFPPNQPPCPLFLPCCLPIPRLSETSHFPAHSSKFQCCTPADAPDACLAKYNYNDTRYDYYDSYKPYYEASDMDDGMFDSLITRSPPILCQWTHTPKMCSPHLLETCLGVGTLNWWVLGVWG
jgi:hypothetical protein